MGKAVLADRALLSPGGAGLPAAFIFYHILGKWLFIAYVSFVSMSVCTFIIKLYEGFKYRVGGK